MPTKKNEAIPTLLLKFRDLKSRIKDAEQQIKGGLQEQLIESIESTNQTTFTCVDFNGVEVTGTVVRGVTMQVDWSELSSKLTDEQIEAIVVTEPRFSDALLKDAMASGLIDPTVVAESSVQVNKAPYIRLSERSTSAAPTSKKPQRPRTVAGKRSRSEAGIELQKKMRGEL